MGWTPFSPLTPENSWWRGVGKPCVPSPGGPEAGAPLAPLEQRGRGGSSGEMPQGAGRTRGPSPLLLPLPLPHLWADGEGRRCAVPGGVGGC